MGDHGPRELVCLGLKNRKALGKDNLSAIGSTREELRGGGQEHGNSAWSRSKLALQRHSGQSFLEAQLQKKKRPQSINLLAHPFIHPLIQSIKQSLGKHLSTYHVLGPMLGFGETHETWTEQDIEVIWLDRFKLWEGTWQLS